MEAWGLGMLVFSAGLFATLLQHPGSPLHQALSNPFVRPALMSLMMGLTTWLDPGRSSRHGTRIRHSGTVHYGIRRNYPV